MDILIHPTYFPNIAHFVAMVKAKRLVFEYHDNFQKQTYRNRTYIFGANGKLLLNIPVHHTQKNRQLYRNVQVSNMKKWQDIHWKALLSAYSTSPFFEFYKDDLKPLFDVTVNNLMTFNIKSTQFIFECLQLDFDYEFTSLYEKSPKDILDCRNLVNCKKEVKRNFDAYTQVFCNKHGYLPNLSILDLLFNEGPNTIDYLHAQNIEF